MKINNCEFPDNILYDTENFVWADTSNIENNGSNNNNNNNRIVTIGITPIIASIAGKLAKVNIKQEGTQVDKDRSIATIESAKYFGVVRTPLSGRIIEINKELVDKPKLANDKPYNEGWFIKIEPSRFTKEAGHLKTIEQCRSQIDGAIHNHRVRCFNAFPDHEMFQIGVECSATLAKLDELIPRINTGEVIHLVSDDTTADIELIRWSDERKQPLIEIRREGNLFHFIIIKKTL